MRISKIWSLVFGLVLLALAGAWMRSSMAFGVREGLYPFARAAEWFRSRVVPAMASVVHAPATAARMAELEEEVARLRLELARVDTIAVENDVFRRQLGFAARVPRNLVACPVLPRGDGGWWRMVRIGRGSSSGIAVGQVALDANGVVGRVSAVSRSTADILLVTDPNFRIACEIDVSTNRVPVMVQGILNGSGARAAKGRPEIVFALEPLALRYLDRDAPLDNLRKGLPVRTSGRGGQVPRGLLLGYLESSEIDPDGLCRTGVVLPAVNAGDLRMVFVMTDGGAQ